MANARMGRDIGRAGSLIVPVILCGGSGSRLWPMSRAQRPKQLLDLVGGGSLLQQTAARFADTTRFAGPMVVCSEQHRFAVCEQLEAIGARPSRIVLEPSGRNTAGALAVAALLAEPGQLLLAVPADGHVSDIEGYVASALAASQAAAEGWLVAFGVEPTRPETGYGYIEASQTTLPGGARRIARYHEKPDLETARGYVAGGGHLWNAGMFLFRAGTFLDECERHAPQVLRPVREALSAARHHDGVTRLDAASFERVPAESVDRAVMEKTSRAAVVRLDTPWSDIGSWHELWRASRHDDDGNVLVGDALVEDCQGSYVQGADGRLVVAIGLQDHVVVSTRDAVMVVPRERAQEVRGVVDRLAAMKRTEQETHPRVFRPWGYYEAIDRGPGFQVKRIMVKPGGRLSLQRHAHRSEHWTIVGGCARVTVADTVQELGANQTAFVPVGAVHRLENLGQEPVFLIEVQCGDYLGEDDIERLEDIYDRAAPRPLAAE